MGLLKSLDWQKIILYAALIVCIYILLTGKCNCNRPIPTPTVKTVTEQKVVLARDEQEIKRLRDSFETVLNKHYKDDDKDYEDYIALLNDNDVLQKNIINLTTVIPDTCKDIVNQYKKYISQTGNTLSFSKKTINGLQNTVNVQKKYLSAKDSAYAKVRKALDTCFAQQSILEKHVSKVKPKREISISALAQSSYIQPYKLAAGIGIGYRNRRGLELNLSVYTNQTVGIGIKKPLFRF